MATKKSTPVSRARLVGAAAKKPVTAASKNKAAPAWSKVQLPAGFRAITMGAYGEEWEYEKHPLLQGEISSEVREVSAGKGKDKRVSRVVTVKSSDDGKSYTVWESASLRVWFDNLHVGQQVAIAFHGYKDVGRPQPMKVFEGAFTDEDADAVGAEEEPTPRRPAAKKPAAKKTRR
jgi:hypothetical protein